MLTINGYGPLDNSIAEAWVKDLFQPGNPFRYIREGVFHHCLFTARAAAFTFYTAMPYWPAPDLDHLFLYCFRHLIALSENRHGFVKEWIDEDEVIRNLLFQSGLLICTKKHIDDGGIIPAPTLISPIEEEVGLALTQLLAPAQA